MARNLSSALRPAARARAARCTNRHNESPGHPPGSSSFWLLSVQHCVWSWPSWSLSLVWICVTFVVPRRDLEIWTCKLSFVDGAEYLPAFLGGSYSPVSHSHVARTDNFSYFLFPAQFALKNDFTQCQHRYFRKSLL